MGHPIEESRLSLDLRERHEDLRRRQKTVEAAKQRRAQGARQPSRCSGRKLPQGREEGRWPTGTPTCMWARWRHWLRRPPAGGRAFWSLVHFVVGRAGDVEVAVRRRPGQWQLDLAEGGAWSFATPCSKMRGGLRLWIVRQEGGVAQGMDDNEGGD